MTNPPLKYRGGKYPMATKLHRLATPHVHRVIAYGGGMGELWNWPYEGISEVYNDIDWWLTNFFRVLQENWSYKSFQAKVRSIPFSEIEWEHHASKMRCLPLTEIDHNCKSTNIDAAVSFFVLCRQSRAGECDNFAPLSRSRTRRNMNEQASAWLTTLDSLPEIHERLMCIVIKNKSAINLIMEEDSPTTLFYLDPPYYHDARTSADDYRFEMSHDQHEELLKLLTGQYCLNPDDEVKYYHQPQGFFMLSGYDNDLYNDYLVGWSKIEFDRANSAASGESKRRMTECVWMNYPLVDGCPVILYDNYL